MLQEADYGLTDTAFQNNSNNRFAGDNNLLVRFVMHPRMNQARSEEEGRPIFEEVPFVQIMIPGNKESQIFRPATKIDKSRFAEHYRKFEARVQDEAIEGTLLAEWPGITRSQVEELKFFNIKTVEQLASMADSNGVAVMGINGLKQRAQEFLLKANDNRMETELQAAREELAALRARLDAKDAAEAAPAPNGDAEEAPAAPKRRRRQTKTDELEA